MNSEKKPLVSIVTPLFNAEKYLAECIESVLAQTYENWEYVIVNNCSTDRSLEIAKNYKKKDKRIIIHENKRFLSLMQNWNHAMRNISRESKYCKVVHADDWIFPECITQMVEVAETYPKVGIVGSYRLDENQVNLDGLTYPEKVFSGKEICRYQILGGKYIFGSPTSILIRSDIITRKKDFYNVSNIHADQEVCFEILKNADFGFVHEILTFTRRHNESATSFTKKFNTYILGNFIVLIKYGPYYLSKKEFNHRLKIKRNNYYKFLSKSVFELREKDFFKFHFNELIKLKNPIKMSKFIVTIFTEALDLKTTFKTLKKQLNKNMIKNKNFIYFGPEKWEGLWRNRHQLMTRFSRQNKVLYVEPFFYFKNIRLNIKEKKLQWCDIKKDIKKNRISTINNNLFIFHSPMFIPISKRIYLNKLTQYFWIKILIKQLNELNIIHPIVWLSRPEMVEFAGKLREKLLIYHVVDEYSSYSKTTKTNKKIIKKYERKMLSKADMVFVVSDNLLKTKKVFNPHTYLVPNAVDFNAYNENSSFNTESINDLSNIPKPIIGYSGLVAKRLDLELIYYLAEKYPEWSIVFVGKIDSDIKLKNMKNIYFLGNKEITELPRIINSFDVCIIPYKMNEQSDNISPLKLYDYFATGKPIVSTKFTEVCKFKEIVRIANSKEEFTIQIKYALAGNDSENALIRKKIAIENSWDSRVIQISEIINTFLRKEKTGKNTIEKL